MIVPEDQVKLSSKELDEDITRVLTANNPQVPQNVVIYNFEDREFKGVPGTADEHVAFHVVLEGSVMHTESEGAADQRNNEKEYRSQVDERRRDLQRAAQEEGKPELTEADLEDDLQRNQFNFTERAAQTYVNPIKTRVVSTTPPETAHSSGVMTQWAMYDAYVAEFERLTLLAQAEKAGAARTEKGGAAASSSGKGGGKRSDDPMHSAAMGHALKVMERMVNQNAEDEIYSDFRYWEDASDQFRDNLGTCLPLWKFEDIRTKRKMVTALAWNPAYPDMFAVGYGSYDFMKQGSGLICVYSLKNVGHPEYTFSMESGVMCLDFHQQYPALLAVGCYDGTVKVHDIRRKENRHIYASDIKSGKHSDPVWEVKWAREDPTKELNFYSVSSDGKVANWVVTKSELKMEVVMTLKLVSSVAAPAEKAGETSSAAAGSASTPGPAAAADDETRLTGLAGGCCFAFNPFQENLFLVGTEEGKVHKCSVDYSGQYLQTYDGHHMAVYAVRWNPFHPRVFLSCSADWSVKLWDHTFPSAPVMTFDLGTAVGDICWAPYSSTVFAAVTDEGKVDVYDLHANKHEQLCEQKIVKKAKCTHVCFNARAPVLLVGDSQGGVTSLKLSPNLRRITPIPAPIFVKGEAAPTAPSREEVEIRKMDRLLALSDAKITIVTPIPGGLVKAKRAGAAGVAADEGDAGPAEASTGAVAEP